MFKIIYSTYVYITTALKAESTGEKRQHVVTVILTLPVISLVYGKSVQRDL